MEWQIKRNKVKRKIMLWFMEIKTIRIRKLKIWIKTTIAFFYLRNGNKIEIKLRIFLNLAKDSWRCILNI